MTQAPVSVYECFSGVVDLAVVQDTVPLQLHVQLLRHDRWSCPTRLCFVISLGYGIYTQTLLFAMCTFEVHKCSFKLHMGSCNGLLSTQCHC